jgi:secreted PhoX family phosphatase
VFEVDPHDEDANRDPRPIKALGRFAHESVAVDPETGAIYQTEDAGNPNGHFYRWTPPADVVPLTKGSLRRLGDDAGVLEAMRATRADGSFVADLSPAREVGLRYDVEWVTVPDRFASSAPIRTQAFARPVTRSRKLEGMWWGQGGAYFVCSFARGAKDNSEAVHDGQVWFFDPESQTIELKIHFEYTEDQDGDPDGPDNITVSPYGGVIVAEDGEGLSHLVGSTKSGETFFLARNEINDSEFTGPTFSTDRKTLFACIQSPGHVFAITGPWARQK